WSGWPRTAASASPSRAAGGPDSVSRPTAPARRIGCVAGTVVTVVLRAAEQAGQQPAAWLDRMLPRVHPARRPQLAGHLAMLLEVALVVLLGAPERGRVRDLGRDRPAPVRLHRRQRRLGRRPLLRRVHEDGGAVLGADVQALAVLLGGIVLAPEHGQQLVVADPLGVVLHLDRLGVAGAAAADGAIVGVIDDAAGVADRRRDDAVDLHEGVLDVPETAGCEDGLLGHVVISSSNDVLSRVRT